MKPEEHKVQILDAAGVLARKVRRAREDGYSVQVSFREVEVAGKDTPEIAPIVEMQKDG